MYDFFEELTGSYDDSRYPEGFTKEYTLMECLSERKGIDTFLAQDKNGDSCVVKCYDKSVYSLEDHQDLLRELHHPGLPAWIGSYENETMVVTVREYIAGTPLDKFSQLEPIPRERIVDICRELCDILGYLHHREAPVIHRDVKPQNVIVREGGDIALIDFDIARVFREGSDTDTRFFGTLAYAPPEQYGFMQTDSRADIYSLGVLLRFLLTQSPRENPNVEVYRPLQKIIDKCTAFSPEDRYSDVDQVKRALGQANPRSRGIKAAKAAVIAVIAAGALALGGVKVYDHITYSPFSKDAVPAVASDDKRMEDAVSYMTEKYDTTVFDDHGAKGDEEARIGDLRKILIECYGLEDEYVYGITKQDIPQEEDGCFLPWGYDDDQLVARDVCVYAAVKAHDPKMVADWSSIKDDNGEYPGTRVALAFAEKYGILQGANRPDDILLGEMAVIFANTDRVFESKKK